MNEEALRRLDLLRSDYERVTGESFEHFYCPILFRDEPAALCKGHVVNQAFPGSSRRWTIQRADVDGFFGRIFEADFIGIQYRNLGGANEVLANSDAARHLKPEVFFGDTRIEVYPLKGKRKIPPYHSAVLVESAAGPVPLVLKLPPEVAFAQGAPPLQVRVDKDFRLVGLVSLLKAAHLTLFDMLGYDYALSAAGDFLGGKVLGAFFRAHAEDQDRTRVLEAAEKHFAEHVHLVRPATEPPSHNSLGTVADRRLYICFRGTEIRWAFLVVIKTGAAYHAVLVPTFKNDVATKIYLDFVRRDRLGEEELFAHETQFRDASWRVSREARRVVWPKLGVDLKP